MTKAHSSADHKRLRDRGLQARLTTIRNAVEPVLRTNNFPQFTDHSVAHSDRLCSILDELTSPFIGSDRQLNNAEAFVLYSACYLHDVGMQHANLGTQYC